MKKKQIVCTYNNMTSKDGDAEKARTEKARTENAAPKCRGGNGENGKVGK